VTWFLDSSAIIKLIVEESESKSLRSFLPASIVASRISRLEVLRNVNRIEPKKLDRAREKMNGLSYVEINEHVLKNAEEIALALEIKSLDSIQAGSALFIKDLIEGVISYDKNLNGALTKLGIKTVSPGV
jgi:predicted nucleic acid-binding OB-fold protein